MTLPTPNLQQAQREPCLTKRQLASELQVSVRTIERLGLPCVKVGNQNRYFMSEVNRALGRNVIELRPRQKERAA